MLISWTHLLDRLEVAGDSHSRVEAQQLRGLAERVDAETEFPPLQLEELAPEIPRRLLGIRRLVDDSTARVVAKGYASIGGKVTPQVRGYGRYLRVANAIAWFGIDSDRWARGSYPDTPLWLHFEQWRIEIFTRTRFAMRSIDLYEKTLLNVLTRATSFLSRSRCR